VKGKIGGPAHTVVAVPAGLDGGDAGKRRQEQYWARRGSEVTVTMLTEAELQERRAAAEAKRAPLPKAPARAEKIPEQGSDEWIEYLLKLIFGDRYEPE
jgi:hypothetical protein